MKTNDKTAPVSQQPDQNAISLNLMNRMKMHGMAEAFRESLAGTTAQAMDPRLLPVNASQPRVGLPRAVGGDKTDKERFVPLQGIPRGN